MSMNDEWDEAERVRREREEQKPKSVWVLTIQEDLEAVFTDPKKALPHLVEYCERMSCDLSAEDIEAFVEWGECEIFHRPEQAYSPVFLFEQEVL